MLVCFLTLLGEGAGAQIMDKIDSAKFSQIHFSNHKFVNNLFQQAIASMTKAPDPGPFEEFNTGKSEKPYLQYQGKYIRHIVIMNMNFDRSFNDTSKRDHSREARLGKALHHESREYVIRDNLFIKEKTKLNAFKVADNERYLRTREYLQDARIVVKPVKHHKDSVDVFVYTKDFFSIAGGASSAGLNHVVSNLYDNNLGGIGQRLELTSLYDKNRGPMWGYGANYRKSNLMHSFIDGTVGYSTMNNNPNTHEEETTEYFSLSRQLVSPYSHFAGGAMVSHNQANNIYLRPDAQFYKYSYDLIDLWAGYNLAIRQLTADNNNIRDRRFLSIRYADKHFNELPTQIGQHYDPFYNNTRELLGQITFFRQDYYKSQYIYGFGTLEDLPYGYNLSGVTGWHQQADLNRLYTGLKASEYFRTDQGEFIQLYMRGGCFWHKDKVQDGSLLMGISAYSRILFCNSTKIRQYINFSYTRLYDRVTTEPLKIDNYYGIRGFLSDSANGNRRISLQSETVFYLTHKVLGFKFAPFPYGDFSLVTPQGVDITKSTLYASLGGGVRARNENLVFGTIEARAYFFPNAPVGMKGFKIILTSNLRYRYISNYITAPNVVQLNVE